MQDDAYAKLVQCVDTLSHPEMWLLLAPVDVSGLVTTLITYRTGLAKMDTEVLTTMFLACRTVIQHCPVYHKVYTELCVELMAAWKDNPDLLEVLFPLIVATSSSVLNEGAFRCAFRILDGPKPHRREILTMAVEVCKLQFCVSSEHRVDVASVILRTLRGAGDVPDASKFDCLCRVLTQIFYWKERHTLLHPNDVLIVLEAVKRGIQTPDVYDFLRLLALEFRAETTWIVFPEVLASLDSDTVPKFSVSKGMSYLAEAKNPYFLPERWIGKDVTPTVLAVFRVLERHITSEYIVSRALDVLMEIRDRFGIQRWLDTVTLGMCLTLIKALGRYSTTEREARFIIDSAKEFRNSCEAVLTEITHLLATNGTLVPGAVISVLSEWVACVSMQDVTERVLHTFLESTRWESNQATCVLLSNLRFFQTSSRDVVQLVTDARNGHDRYLRRRDWLYVSVRVQK